jgi:hypothetical protein
MEVAKPLNPELYTRLQRNVSTVVIANPGERFVSTVKLGINGRPKELVSQSGEYYRACCPFCKDTRHRLWINHRYGVIDEATRNKNTHLAICYNEDCLHHPARRRQLENMIFTGMNWAHRKSVTVSRGVSQEDKVRVVEPPGMLIPVDQLDPESPAVAYLISRGYDPVELGQRFNVSYCEFADSRYPASEGRIVAALMMDDQLVGWQCRYVGDIDWKSSGVSKYYTRPGMPKRLMLYNYDQAKAFPLVVLTEGVTDVWAVGPQAVALLGKKLHPSQERLLWQTWGHGTLVIMLDADAHEEITSLVNRLAPKFSGGVVPVYLEGADPGDLDREFIWDIITTKLKQSGYKMVRTDVQISDDGPTVS